MLRRSKALFYKEYEGAHKAKSWETGGPCCEHLDTLMFGMHATELTITSSDHVNHHQHRHHHPRCKMALLVSNLYFMYICVYAKVIQIHPAPIHLLQTLPARVVASIAHPVS